MAEFDWKRALDKHDYRLHIERAEALLELRPVADPFVPGKLTDKHKMVLEQIDSWAEGKPLLGDRQLYLKKAYGTDVGSHFKPGEEGAEALEEVTKALQEGEVAAKYPACAHCDAIKYRTRSERSTLDRVTTAVSIVSCESFEATSAHPVCKKVAATISDAPGWSSRVSPAPANPSWAFATVPFVIEDEIAQEMKKRHPDEPFNSDSEDCGSW